MTVAAVRIERLAAGGDGVGKLADGRTVFVPRTAPGDLIELAQVKLHARFARARVGQVIEPGEGRVVPRCRHYVGHDCGGCQFQHLDNPTQLSAKRTILADALQRIAKVEIDVPPVIAAVSAWDYRSRITLAPGKGNRFAGFHPVDQPARVFPLERCEIAQPAVRDLWDALKDHLTLLPPDTETITLRVDRQGGEHLAVRAEGKQAWTEAVRLAGKVGRPRFTIWWQPKGGVARIMAGQRDTAPGTVFEQVFPVMGDQVRAHALQQLGDVNGQHGWDLYSGIGETTEALVGRGATIESIELDTKAVEWASSRLGGSARAIRGSVETELSGLAEASFVVTNPPRTGMGAQVVGEILKRPPPRMVYISCDPATLARDLQGLGARYRPVSVQGFDLFPQTAHLETVALLEAA